MSGQRDANGLTKEEARERLAAEGYNDLPAPERHSPLALVAEVMREPMFGLLVGAAVLYAVIGDIGEALVLFAFATMSVSIAVVQRGRSERVLEALRDLTSPRALVIRDGERRRIPGREVVRGDTIVIAEGDRVPADAALFMASDLRLDESLLTGESAPVDKVGESRVFSGTLVVRGTGMAIVTATGLNSEIGKIGRVVGGITAEQPRLQAQTRRLVVIFSTLGLAVSVVAVLLYGLFRGDWLHALLGGIALAMSMLPEEFPLVLTVFMVMGAWRLSKSLVLTRRAAAIETLGSATVLCTDKTGTLTRNSMTVVRLCTGSQRWQSEDAGSADAVRGTLSELLRAAALASDGQALEPMECAIHDLVRQSHVALPTGIELQKVYPLRRDLLAVTQIWKSPPSETAMVAAKGAPEAIAKLCRLSTAQKIELLAQVDRLAAEGVRVLAVASGTCPVEQIPETAGGLSLNLLGLVGFADPLRDSVPEAVRQCRSAGIRIVMITGDYPLTALAIARQAGIEASHVMSGDELDALDEAAIIDRVRNINVFARITPVQKLRLVEAMKEDGEIVAMTGDGVNDAPALKAAHIGIAMGGRGTDVAREAASLVLLDDDFGSIVKAIRLGRRIYDNLRKAMGFILAVHVPIAGIALMPVILGWPLMLTPMLIALLELIIDPACSIVLEAEREEKDVMSRPPRNTNSALIPLDLAVWSILQGLIALTVVAAVFASAMFSGVAEDEVRTIVFVTLVGANIALIFVNRTFDASVRSALMRLNPLLWWGIGIVGAVLVLIVSWRGLAQFLGLGPIDVRNVAIAAACALGLLTALQLLKGGLMWRRSVRSW